MRGASGTSNTLIPPYAEASPPAASSSVAARSTCPVGTEERFTGSSEPSGCVEGFTSMMGLVGRTMSSAMYHSPWSAVTTMVASSYKPSRLSSSRYSLTIWREPSPCSMAPVPSSTVSALRFSVYGGWGPAR